jgi:hypothetical protein
VTGLLTTCGSQFRDWTSRYRLFSRPRLPVETIFSVVRRAVLAELPAQAPVCAVLDDTLLRRSGLHTPGVGWRRDPLGPRFQTNFVRAQRFLQTSLALPAPDGSCRVLPVAFRHTPTLPKPSKKATDAERKKYRAEVRAARLSQRAREQIGDLRAALDADPSVESAPALTVASYALLLLATQRAFAGSRDALLPRPRWMPPSPSTRISTQQAIHQLRAEVWGRGLGLDNFSPFASSPPAATKPKKSSFPLASAVCYANA